MPDIAFPYACSTTASKLPIRAKDGQIVCDQEGNLWQFEADSGAWTNRGTLESPIEVSETQDGLVTSDVFSRLSFLKLATESGKSIPQELKILPHTDVYWYLFTSPDKLIKFTPEGQNVLRMEVDRSRLFLLLAGSSCRGPKGQKGDTGDPGPDAPAGGPETCFAPSVVADRQLSFSLVVPTPLDTEISLRLSSDATKIPAITVSIIPSSGLVTIISVDQSISLDNTRTIASISYDINSQLLVGSFILAAGFWTQLPALRCILAKQKGPVGDPGNPGKCFPSTQACNVNHTDLQFTSPIIAMRRGCNAEQVLTVSSNLFGKVCVSQLAFDVISPDYANVFRGSALDGRLLAARQTLDPCKDIAIFKPLLTVIDKPELVLPQWNPQSDCNVFKRAQQSDLNWVPGTDVPATSTLWETLAGLSSPEYPWPILIDPAAAAGKCDPCVTPPVVPPCPDNTTTTPKPVF